MIQSDPKKVLKRHDNVDYGVLSHNQEDNSNQDDESNENKNDKSIDENVETTNKIKSQ